MNKALNTTLRLHSVNPFPPSPVFLLSSLSLSLQNNKSPVLEEREQDKIINLLREIVFCLVMEDSKRAAKAFVDQYFPVNEPKPKSADVFDDLFSLNPKMESPKKQVHEIQNLNAQIATADSKNQGDSNKSQNACQKSSDGDGHSEISEPCLMSSSVDYGCRDNYPYNPDNRYPGPSYYAERKDRKDGSEHANPEVAGGAEWWQGSLYY